MQREDNLSSVIALLESAPFRSKTNTNQFLFAEEQKKMAMSKSQVGASGSKPTWTEEEKEEVAQPWEKECSSLAKSAQDSS